MTLHPGRHDPGHVELASSDLDPIQRALQENEDWHRDLVEHSQDLLCVHDLRGRLLLVNPAPARVLGYSVEEILRIPMREIIVPEFREAFDAYLQQIASKGEAHGLMAVLTRSGERRIWEFHNTLRTEGVATPIVRGMAHDVTERVRAERVLRETNADLRRAQSVAHIGSWSYDLRRRRIAFSEETYRIVGLPLGSPVGAERVMDVIHPDDRVLVVAAFTEALVKGHCDLVHRITMQGNVRRVHTIADIQTGADGEPLSAVGTVQDVTERRAAEAHSRLLASIVHSASDAIFSMTADDMITSCNPGVDRIYGYTPAELIGKPLLTLVPPGREDEYRAMMSEALQGRPTIDLDTVRVRKDGSRVQVSVTASPIRDETGAVQAVSVVHRDITVRKRAEEELHRISEELRRAKEKLAEEKLYLEQEMSRELGCGEIVGQSKALKEVMEQARRVAASDATVLLLGETGTGKELIARAVHRLSSRSGSSFIKMNCAAVPSGLLESELFGHEKGAFTGAVSKKIGRLELADKGTLFLDEVGEIPPSMQPKLLRVLQDQEFERLGSTHTVKVDFRLIAATNRDLAGSVRDKQFRSDLYYRLSVFPIRIPPLRERRDDIPLLVEHVVSRCARRMGKAVTSIPKATLDALTRWDWPGNVRELENLLERSVILTRGPVLEVPLSEFQAVPEPSPQDRAETAERERILRTLSETRGKLGGNRGAAARLGMSRSALLSKLRRLRIDPSLFHD